MTTSQTNQSPSERAAWGDTFPDCGGGKDAYYFVRRKDSQAVVVAGFSMGYMWVNGVGYEPNEITNHLFLGPLSPEQFESVEGLCKENEALKEAAQEAIRELSFVVHGAGRKGGSYEAALNKLRAALTQPEIETES